MSRHQNPYSTPTISSSRRATTAAGPRPGSGARRQRRWKASWSMPNDPLVPALGVQLEQRRRAAARRPRRGATHSKPHALALEPPREAPQLADEVLRGLAGLGGERAAPAAGRPSPRPRGRPPAALCAGQPGGRAAHEQRRAPPRRRSSQRGHGVAALAAPPARRSGRRRPAPLPALAYTGTASGRRPVQPLAIAAQRDERLQAAGRDPARPPARVRGRAASVSHHASTQSGVWKYELPSCRSASSSQSRRERRRRRRAASRSTTSGSMPAACAAPRSASPTGRSSPP